MVRNLKDAFYNAQFRVGQGIYTRAVSQGDNSLTESNFTGNDTFDTLIEDDTGALPEFVDSQISMSDAASNDVAMNKISASQTAMDAVAASQTAMESVSASQTAMDAVSASQTAMDAVSASQTARDVIGFSGLAYDTIANSNMAIGKYAIGYTTESPSDFADMDAVAGSQTAMDAVVASQLALDTVAGSQTAMDAVAGSQTAMDAVAGSQTAMDAVAGSLIGRTGILKSTFDSVWSSQSASQTIWDAFEVSTTSTNGTASNQLVSNGIGGYELELSIDGGDAGDPTNRGYKLDLTNISSLEFQLETAVQDPNETNYIRVRVDSTTVFEITTGQSDATETVDLSSYSGQQTVYFEVESDAGWDIEYARFDQPTLIE